MWHNLLDLPGTCSFSDTVCREKQQYAMNMQLNKSKLKPTVRKVQK